MAQILHQKMARHDDARSLLRAIYNTEVDILPDQQAKTLAIQLHPLANQSSDEAIRHLCDELNATGTLFPATELRLIYKLVSAHFTPTSASWLNQVERFFGLITEDRIRRGVFRSVPELVAAIHDYLEHHNAARLGRRSRFSGPTRLRWSTSRNVFSSSSMLKGLERNGRPRAE
jgi:hypothetical protein